MNPRFPVFIPSKGRATVARTPRGFDAIGVPYTLFIEPQEEPEYRKAFPFAAIHILPHQNKGLTVTRNYIWDFAAAQGHEWFWTFDDNIAGSLGTTPIYRFNNNLKVPCADGTPLFCIEDFTLRYENIAIAGMNYFMFASRKSGRISPYTLNTRIYSNMLIRTFAKNRSGEPYRNMTFYNDDTDLCLRVLKDGWATVLFNAFLIYKQTTMTVQGGMTEYYNKTDKRLEFVKELYEAHPDVVQLTEKWGRWHHHVDYSGFKQRLIRRPDIQIPDCVNNFGMVLQERKAGNWARAEIL